MKFKSGSRYGIPEEKQGLIYFTCVNYRDRPENLQHLIMNLCLEIGGEHYQALFEAVTTRRNILPVASDHYMDESTLWRLCRDFYREYYRRYEKRQ